VLLEKRHEILRGLMKDMSSDSTSTSFTKTKVREDWDKRTGLPKSREALEVFLHVRRQYQHISDKRRQEMKDGMHGAGAIVEGGGKQTGKQTTGKSKKGQGQLLQTQAQQQAQHVEEK